MHAKEYYKFHTKGNRGENIIMFINFLFLILFFELISDVSRQRKISEFAFTIRLAFVKMSRYRLFPRNRNFDILIVNFQALF